MKIFPVKAKGTVESTTMNVLAKHSVLQKMPAQHTDTQTHQHKFTTPYVVPCHTGCSLTIALSLLLYIQSNRLTPLPFAHNYEDSERSQTRCFLLHTITSVCFSHC